MIDSLIRLLQDRGSLSEETALKLRNLYREDPETFNRCAVEQDHILETDLLTALGELYGLPVHIRVFPGNSDHDFVSKLSVPFLKKHLVVPFITEKGQHTIAINDPGDMLPSDDIADILDWDDVEMILAPKAVILSVITDICNRGSDSAQQLVDTIEESGSAILKEIEQTADLLDDTSDAPVIRLVNHMISQSVKANASDIHIEPFQDSLNVRYRIDGILYDMISPPKWIQSSLISRIKVMANMNIAEKRIPQDGRIEVRIGEQKIDIRVSTVPTSFGERLVMRLLNKSGSLLELAQFGISEHNMAIVNRLIRMNNGIVLVTGPTGSGKTTTLYAALSVINSPDKNIITIEDPVEYNLRGIGQIQVNAKIGVTFAQGLRSIVRQDPDVILVGEIRDFETAEIAIQSALTGHLVFSTLHTNDSAGAITRLNDLGVEPYLITSAVRAVIAQRLVRVLCKHCRKPYDPEPEEVNSLGMTADQLTSGTIYKAAGCPRCFNTGYSGRKAVFEIMEISDRLKSIILQTSDSNTIKEEAIARGMTTLRQNGIDKVLNGITTVEEVLRVTQE